MNDNQPSADCSASCQEFQISGNNAICGSESYSISPGLPGNSTILWTVLPTGIVSIVAPNNTEAVTLNRTGIGPFTLTATISNACSPGGMMITKNITAYTGTINITGTYNSPTNSAEPIATFSPKQLPPQYNPACIAFVVTPQFAGGGGIMLSPNPASNNLMESFGENTNNNSQKAIKEIRIIDKMGNIKQTLKYVDAVKNISLNISMLKSDVYIVQVFDGQTWYSEKFMKN